LEQAETSESGAHALSRLVQLATARLVQEALEQEQTDFIGRERYVRQAGRGKRNGYVPGQLDTAEGRVRVEVPQVREARAPCRSALCAGNTLVVRPNSRRPVGSSIVQVPQGPHALSRHAGLGHSLPGRGSGNEDPSPPINFSPYPHSLYPHT
jgi:hypothetical protein